MNHIKCQITGTSGRRFGKCSSFKEEFRMLRKLEVLAIGMDLLLLRL